MAIQVPFPLPSTGYALNSKVRINLDFLVGVFNEFNTGSASWDQVVIGTQNSVTGTLSFYNASNSYYIQFLPSTSSTENQAYTLPTAKPTVAPSMLTSSTAGVMKWKELKGTSGQITVTDNTSDVTLSYTNPSGLGGYVALYNATAGTGLLDDQIDSGGNIFRITISGLGSLTGNSNIVLPAPASGSTTMVTEAGAAFTGDVSVDETATLSAYDFHLRPATGGGRTVLNHTNTASIITWYLPAAQGGASTCLTNDGSGNLTWQDPGSVAGSATTELDNLGTVAINTTLVSDTDVTDDLGTTSKAWRNVYAKDLYAGRSGVGGVVYTYPSTAAKGWLAIYKAANTTSNTETGINVADQSGSRVYTVPDAGASANFVLSQASITMPTTNASGVLTNNGSGTLSWGAGSGATTALDNLASVAINTSLISDTNNTDDLGSSAKKWKDVYANGVVGTTTNDSADAGRVGEILEGTGGPGAMPATGTWGDVTSVALTAGDWDVSVIAYYDRNGATWQEVDIGISSTSGNSGAGMTAGINRAIETWASTSTAVLEKTLSIPSYRVSLASTTTYYLKSLGAFSVSTPQVTGRISARRVR